MTDEPDTILEAVFSETIRLHQRVREQDRQPILRAVETIVSAFRHGGKVMAFGNGGSAADSQHFAAELVGRFARERQALPALALTTDTSVLTALSNDYQFERVFARQVEALGRAGDVVLGISTSGGSRNVLAAFSAAKARGLTTIGLTGRDGGPVGAAADIHINVPTQVTARAQEVHRTLLHAICELIERDVTRQD